VHFIDLGPLKDAALVAGTVAAALSLVVHHADPKGSIIGFLRSRRLLVFESLLVEGDRAAGSSALVSLAVRRT
jgi:predicted ATPase